MAQTNTVERVFSDGNKFYITGEFDEEMEKGVIWSLTKKINDLKSQKNAVIELYISSVGGNGYILAHIVELVELAKRNDITVRTIVTSHAYSCGSLLAVTGTKGERYISRYAEHLVHYGQFDGYRKSTPLQIEKDAARWKRWAKLLFEHYQKYSAIPDLTEHLKDDNYWIPADKCIKWGLADKYMDELEL